MPATARSEFFSPTLGPMRAFDRLSGKRGDTNFLSTARNDARARTTVLVDLKPAVSAAGASGAIELIWLSRTDLASAGLDQREQAFLGVDEAGRPHFSIAIAGHELPKQAARLLPPECFAELRALAVAGQISPTELSIAGEARALAEWHRTHPCCSRCGAQTKIVDGGWRRHCWACEREHFPRTDPVVIMLVTEGDACLLGHAPRFPGRMFSALAGFLEPGEDIEHAVAREVKEEVGLDVSEVTYLASQPWPFPHSLMIGCLARAKNRDVTLDPAEIDEVVWADKAAVEQMFAGTHPADIIVPPPYAIAHQLVQHWRSKHS